MTLFVHVEEESMETALQGLLPRMRPQEDWKIINHGSKDKLLKALPQRLQGYAAWNDPALRILVLVDRDADDCRALKTRLEDMARHAGLATKSAPAADGGFKVVNRVVIEELEAWFFGDVPALTRAFPGFPETLAQKTAYRDPDAIKGGTWEKLLKALQDAGYYTRSEKLPKVEVARKVTAEMTPDSNRSTSFQHFRTGLAAL